MRRFLSRLATFLVYLSLYCVFMVVVNYGLFALLRPSHDPARVMIVGDSHLMRAVDPVLFERGSNFCTSGEAYAVTYWKLRSLIDRVDPDTVLLSLSPGNLSSYTDRMFWLDDVAHLQFSSSYRILDLPMMFKDFRVNKRELAKVLFTKTALYPNVRQFGYRGGFVSGDRNDLESGRKKFHEHYSRREGPAGVGHRMIDYLDSALLLCQRRGVEPIVVVTPLHRNYLDRVPPAIYRAFERKRDSLVTAKVTVIDAMDWPYPDALFQDVDHLNQLGADQFTRELKTRLSGLDSEVEIDEFLFPTGDGDR